MSILALDLGTKTGWAVADSSAPPLPAWKSGNDDAGGASALRYYEYGIFNGPAADHGKLFSRFASWLERTIEIYDIDRIAFEGNVFGAGSMKSANAVIVLVGLTSQTIRTCYEQSLSHTMLMQSVVQKHAVGVGNDSQKRLRKERLKGLRVEDHNTGDAIFVLSCYLQSIAARRSA